MKNEFHLLLRILAAGLLIALLQRLEMRVVIYTAGEAVDLRLNANRGID